MKGMEDLKKTVAILGIVLILVITRGVTAQTITMAAKDFSYGTAWEYRDAPYLGIKGTHVVLSGTASKTFPGESGTYKVVMGVQLEADGAPKYKVSAARVVLKSGSYEYACNGKLYCENYPCPTTRNATIDIGTHEIKKGALIERWGESTYPCPAKDGTTHGAYSRWKDLVFTRVASTVIRGSPALTSVLTPGTPIRAFGIDGRPVKVLNKKSSITMIAGEGKVRAVVRVK